MNLEDLLHYMKEGVAEEIDLVHEEPAKRKKEGVNALPAFSSISFYSNWACP